MLHSRKLAKPSTENQAIRAKNESLRATLCVSLVLGERWCQRLNSVKQEEDKRPTVVQL